MKIIFVQNAKIQCSKRRGHKRQRICSYFDFKELQHFGIHHTKKPKTFDPHYLPLLICSSAYASWMESNAISLSQKQIICDLESPTLGQATRRCAASEALPCFTPWNEAVNRVLLISLSVQTHWRKVESVCFVAESNLQWCILVSVSSARLLQQHPHVRERVEGIKTQGLVNHGYPVHPVFIAFRHTICCAPNALLCGCKCCGKENMFWSTQAGLLVYEKRKNGWLKMSRAAAEVCGESVSDPSLCDSAPWWKQNIHMRTGWFMVSFWRETRQHRREGSFPPSGNLKLPLHVTILYCSIVDYLMEYCRVLQYHSEAAGAAVSH